MRPIVTVIKVPEPVIDIARARTHCRIFDAERDVELGDAIETARAWVQERLHRAVGAQTLALRYPTWCGSAELPFDVTTLQSVTVDGVAVAPAPALGGDAGRTLSLATTGVVVATIVAGYTPDTLPGPVKSAMLLMIADLIRNPAAQTQAQLYENPAVDNLLYPYITEVPL